MAYVLTSDVIEYGNWTGSDDDVLVGRLIDRAQGLIELYSGKIFQIDSDSETTRRFTSTEDGDGALLFLDKDLAVITTIIAGETTLQASDYITKPANDTPYFAIVLRANSSINWGEATADGDFENNISVLGQWAHSTSPPVDIFHATIRLTRWLYKQRDTDADLDRPLLTGDGITIMPSQLPKDVMDIIMKYNPGLII